MRLLLAAVSALAIAACGEQQPAEPVAPATPEAVEPAPVETAVAVVPPAEVAAKLAGTWTSIDDPKASLVITAEGQWTDKYADGDVNHTHPWRAITGAEAQAAAPAEIFTPAATYLEVKRPEAVYYYELGAVSADAIEMFYVGRGNRLAYTRAQ